MAEYIENEEKIINVGESLTFENKTDSSFEVSAGIVFHKDGVYLVSISDSHISVEKQLTAYYIPSGIFYKCSNCGNATRIMKKYNIPNYCPACGSKIVGVIND